MSEHKDAFTESHEIIYKHGGEMVTYDRRDPTRILSRVTARHGYQETPGANRHSIPDEFVGVAWFDPGPPRPIVERIKVAIKNFLS